MDRPNLAARGDSMQRDDRMRSATLRRVLSVTAITGLTIIALSVVAGTVVESRGPGADQLPQVSLPTPIDAGVVVAEVTSVRPCRQAPSTLAPTTTTVPAPGHDGPARPAVSVPSAAGSTRPTRNTDGTDRPLTAPLATTQAPAPTTTERDSHPPAGLHRDGDHVPHTWVTIAPYQACGQDDNHDSRRVVDVPRLPTTWSCLATVRESDDDD